MVKDMRPASKRRLEDFRRDRAHQDDLASTRLFKEASELQKLDKHVRDFLEDIKKDAKNHHVDDLKAHAREFEEEINEQAIHLVNIARQNIAQFKVIMNELQEFKKQMYKLSKDGNFSPHIETDLQLADLLIVSATEKLHSLERIFQRMKG